MGPLLPMRAHLPATGPAGRVVGAHRGGGPNRAWKLCWACGGDLVRFKPHPKRSRTGCSSALRDQQERDRREGVEPGGQPSAGMNQRMRQPLDRQARARTASLRHSDDSTVSRNAARLCGRQPCTARRAAWNRGGGHRLSRRRGAAFVAGEAGSWGVAGSHSGSEGRCSSQRRVRRPCLAIHAGAGRSGPAETAPERSARARSSPRSAIAPPATPRRTAGPMRAGAASPGRSARSLPPTSRRPGDGESAVLARRLHPGDARGRRPRGPPPLPGLPLYPLRRPDRCGCRRPLRLRDDPRAGAAEAKPNALPFPLSWRRCSPAGSCCSSANRRSRPIRAGTRRGIAAPISPRP